MDEDTLRSLEIAREAIRNYIRTYSNRPWRAARDLGRSEGAHEALRLLDAAFSEEEDE